MEPSSSSPQTPATAPPKLAIDKFAADGIVCLRLSGIIDESFEGKKLAESIKAQTLVIDAGDIRKVSSFGIREWVDFVTLVGARVSSIVLVECAPKIVDQLNMVGNFAGSGRVFSFYAPYRCDYCDKDDRVLYQVDRDHDAIKAMKPPERPCGQCGELQYFNDDPVTFFSYLAAQDKFELEPDVANFLAARLQYAVSDGARKLRIDKAIDGRTTLVRLSGDLDKSFPRDKLAEGLEGVVVIDVGGIGKIEPAGAAEWRGLVQQITPVVEAIYLTAVAPSFLDKLTRADDLGAKGQVLSVSLPYTCAKCGVTAGQLIDVDDHFDVLKFATPPDLKCAECKSPMVCAAAEGLLMHLPNLPRPALGAELKQRIAALRGRKAPAKKAATTVAEVATRGGTGLGTAFVAATAAVGLAAAAYFLYTEVLREPSRASGRGSLTAASGDARPGFVVTDQALAAACQPGTDGVVCSGVSGLASSSDEALDEATDAALDGLAAEIASRITDPTWRTQVGNLFAPSRLAKLAAADKTSADARARREVRELRRAVAKAMRATSSGAVPAAPSGRYWEEYTSGAIRQYVGFAAYTVSPAEMKRLVDGYQAIGEALGARAVTAFPHLAWRYPEVSRGAVLVAVDAGPLRDLGLAPGYVVLEIGGRDVTDAAGFAQIARDEMARLKQSGGTLRFEVQSGDGEAKTFSSPIHPDRPAADAGPRRSSGGERDTGPSGSVNVWDRYGGGRSGRDDPTQ